MGYQNVFRRYEIKYLIDREQERRLRMLIPAYMHPDAYGRSVIRNIYYDTPDHRLIRRSLEGPVYKEKLRIRSYQTATADSTVFVELKKKYDSVVYKRRAPMTEAQAREFMECHRAQPETQILREIGYVLDFYEDLRPTVYLSCEREAFYGNRDAEFRLTLDDRIMGRTTALSLCAEPGGERLLAEDTVLLEVKTAGALPLWLVDWLTAERIYKNSFSKYGAAYRQLINTTKGEREYV